MSSHHHPATFGRSITPAILLLGLPFAVLAGAAEAEKETPARVEVTVTATSPDPIDAIGNTTVTRDSIGRQTTASRDLNEVARTMNNTQFDTAKGALSEASILNLRPSLISISGGRTSENNFVVEGLSTTSVTDTTNTNIHAYDSVVGHPQTTFISPGLVDSITIYESDIPAKFGSFTGGVFDVKMRDPAGRWGAGIGYAYTSSDWVHYLTAPEDETAVMPEKPTFRRDVIDGYLDLPTTGGLSVLLAWSRTTSILENTQKLAAYGSSTRAETVSDNYSARILYAFSPENKLRFTSIWSPYEQENMEQDLKIQNNDGWLNKLELTRTTDTSEFIAYAGYQWADNSREQEPNLYNYKNFGAGDKVDWVADTSTSASTGGNGDMDSSQRDIPIGGEATFALTETGKLSFGGDYIYTQARKQRPTTNNAYRHQNSATVVKDPTVTSALGADDPTVIEGEQALNYRLTYYAFDAKVELQSADAWAQWADQGRLFGLPWSYRAGLRYDTNDFLSNHDLAPRLTGQIEPYRWLKLHAGVNRYYTHAMLAYKLQEIYPDTFAYTRSYTTVNGKKVYSDNWTLSLHSKPANYSQADLKTPYSDELSYGFTLDSELLGSLYIHFIQRKTRDEFARDNGVKVPYVNEKTGLASNYTKYTLSNEGYTDYQSTAVKWTKTWRNHAFLAGATFSDTETSTTDYFSENNDEQSFSELVSLNGILLTRREVELQRANYARPTYVNLAWSSSWLNNRLKLDLLGRWNTAYNRAEYSNSTIKVDGVSYERYNDVHIPAGIVNDLNVQWTFWETRAASLSIELKIGNLLDRLPYSEGATLSDPYQEGRSVWAKTSYTF